MQETVFTLHCTLGIVDLYTKTKKIGLKEKQGGAVLWRHGNEGNTLSIKRHQTPVILTL